MINNQQIKKYWSEGYTIVRNLIPHYLIDQFINEFDSVKYNQNLKVHRMDSQTKDKLEIDQSGRLVNPIADIHLSRYYDKCLENLNNKALDVLSCSELLSVLGKIHSADSLTLVMSMFFDMNKGTPPHQDSYYLDTIPTGNLTASWIAFEDIHEEAGRFYVSPNSNSLFLELTTEETINSDLYENIIDDLISKGELEIISPELKKGDVLFWNSNTVHGSHKSKNKKFSRKSFTAHYIPNDKTTKFVQNRYLPNERNYDFFEKNNLRFRITNSIKESLPTRLKGRSLASFKNEK